MRLPRVPEVTEDIERLCAIFHSPTLGAAPISGGKATLNGENSMQRKHVPLYVVML